MYNHKNYFAALLVVGLFLLAAPIGAQVVYGQPASGHTRMTYVHWNIDDALGNEDAVSQFVIPIGGFIPLRDNLEMRFSVANASTSADVDGGDELGLSGLSDMRLQFNQSMYEDRVLVSLGVNLPTGKKKLDLGEEIGVMDFLSRNYLTFPLRRLGEGPGVNLLVGGATTRGNARFGASVMYQYAGTYEPYEEEGDYNPGDFFSINFSADSKKGNMQLHGSIGYTTYGADKAEDVKIRKSSDQFDIIGGLATGNEMLTWMVDTRLLLRGRYTGYDGNEDVFEQLRLYGNEFALGAGVVYHPQKLWSLTPSLDLRIVGGNEFDDERKDEGATIIGFGGDFARSIGEGVNLGLGLRYFTGSADGGDIDISGYQIMVGLQAAL